MDDPSSDNHDAASSASDDSFSSLPLVELTGVVRTFKEDGKDVFVDEAEWQSRYSSNSATRDKPLLLSRDNSGGKDTLTIKSPFLIALVTKIAPRPDVLGITKRNDALSFPSPYSPLYWYYDKIIASADDSDGLSQQDADDLRALRHWYERWILPEHNKIRNTIKAGYVTFDHLWAVFEPNETVYRLDSFKQPCLRVVAAVAYRVGSGTPDIELISMFPGLRPSRRRFAIETWHQDWDASLRTFKRRTEVMVITSYTGSRRIIDLEAYPLRYFGEGSQSAVDDVRKALEKRGRRWKDLVGSSTNYLVHKGPATEMRQQGAGSTTNMFLMRSENVENKYLHDRVIIDHSGYIQNGATNFLSMIGDMMDNMSNGVWGEGGNRKEPPILMGAMEVDEFPDAPNEQDPSKEFSNLQSSLCPSTVFCCSPSTRVWYQVTLANLTDVVWRKDAMDGLIMTDSGTRDGLQHNTTKETLRGLVEAHTKGQLDGTLTDFIENKGQALIIVLHGPPGVGKTLTAESLAEHTEKPLLKVNVGQLAHEQDIEQRLGIIFELSVRWGAILLMDEADVVLEKRSYENHKRNGIVSVFLRMSEYYRGILFLTTNRLRTMDIAFQSRVSLAVEFHALGPEQRKQIWRIFIDRLDPSEIRAKAELTSRLDAIKDWDLNGRQIFNVLKMAQSLALVEEKRRGAMRLTHVERIVDKTLDFQNYFKEDHQQLRTQLGHTLGQTLVRRSVVPGNRPTYT